MADFASEDGSPPDEYKEVKEKFGDSLQCTICMDILKSPIVNPDSCKCHFCYTCIIEWYENLLEHRQLNSSKLITISGFTCPNCRVGCRGLTKDYFAEEMLIIYYKLLKQKPPAMIPLEDSEVFSLLKEENKSEQRFLKKVRRMVLDERIIQMDRRQPERGTAETILSSLSFLERANRQKVEKEFSNHMARIKGDSEKRCPSPPPRHHSSILLDEIPHFVEVLRPDPTGEFGRALRMNAEGTRNVEDRFRTPSRLQPGLHANIINNFTPRRQENHNIPNAPLIFPTDPIFFQPTQSNPANVGGFSEVDIPRAIYDQHGFADLRMPQLGILPQQTEDVVELDEAGLDLRRDPSPIHLEDDDDDIQVIYPLPQVVQPDVSLEIQIQVRQQIPEGIIPIDEISSREVRRISRAISPLPLSAASLPVEPIRQDNSIQPGQSRPPKRSNQSIADSSTKKKSAERKT